MTLGAGIAGDLGVGAVGVVGAHDGGVRRQGGRTTIRLDEETGVSEKLFTLFSPTELYLFIAHTVQTR